MTRDDFAEAALLLEGITNYSQHQILTPAEFFQGSWEFLQKSPELPHKTDSIAKNGNEAIAQSVISYFQ